MKPTYYIYAKPDGTPDVTTYVLPEAAYPGYTLVGEAITKPDLDGKRYENGAWVSAMPDIEHILRRRRQYPSIGDQLDALWHAMNAGTLPKVEPFYSDIKAVKDANPKPSN